MPDFLNELRRLVGEPNLLTSSSALAPYLREWRGRFTSEALAVVRPARTAEVSAVVGCCADAGVGVVPQGGNTGLVGGAVAHADQIILCLERLDAIRAVDADNDTITVEAGVILSDVQRAAAAVGRLFPLSLAAEDSARIGGNLATNAGGLNVLRYGNARELTLGLEVVLADGRVWDGLAGLRKDNAGYDLKHWFIGSEGTLGIITAAVLRLFLPPVQTQTAMIAIPDPATALMLLSALRRASGDNVVACELLPRLALELVCRHMPGCRDPLQARARWYLLVELASPAAGGWLADALTQTLTSGAQNGQVIEAAIARDSEQAADFWRLRESVPAAQTCEGASIKHDVSVPVARLPAFVAETQAALESALPGVRVCAFGHVGDGNLHFNLCEPVNAEPAGFLAQSALANRIVHDIAVRMGGSFAAEHGIGRLKPGELARYADPTKLALMRAIKQALDPQGILNPGAVIPPG